MLQDDVRPSSCTVCGREKKCVGATAEYRDRMLVVWGGGGGGGGGRGVKSKGFGFRF